jgi:internalin A
LRHGELISGFMKRIARADQLIVVLSDKYLRSRYCMTELYDIYRRSIGAEDDFQSRVNPLVLNDVRIDDWEHRVAYAKFWEEEYKKMEPHLAYLGPASRELFNNMREWPFRIDEMLGFLNKKLGPRGFDEIVKDHFAALRQMLSGRR